MKPLSFASLILVLILGASSGSVAHPRPPAPTARQAAPASAPSSNLQDALPFDAAVTRGTLPNGLTYYIRRNGRPAQRVMLRLAVKAGSIDEADDQQGLAHLIEHLAFDGSAHFKPGEVISYFESKGARLGPHVNASTGFEETIFMLDLPTDAPDVVSKGLQAFADFAGGLTFDPAQVQRERGVVIEEWRGGLGAASRIRDKQVPVIYDHSHFAARLPIGKPEIIRTAPIGRVRAFYDTFYRPARMAVVAVGDMDPAKLEEMIRASFGPLKARSTAPVPPRNDAVPLNTETLFNVATDPEATRSSITIMRKRPREPEVRVADYRRDLVERLVEQMFNERFDELMRRPDARFLVAGTSTSPLSPKVEAFTIGATVQDGRITDGAAALGVEAKRVREYGFGAPALARAGKDLVAFYERAYAERDKTESASFASEYLNNFLEGEPSPGIEYEYRLVEQLLPGITERDTSDRARSVVSEGGMVVLAVSPLKPDIRIPTADDLRATLETADKLAVTPWNETAARAELMPHKPEPAAVTSRRELPALGVTIVRFANGVEAWLKPTDFKNDEVVFTLYAQGGTSLATPEDFVNASLAPIYVGLSGAGGLSALDLQKLLAGKLVSASPFIGLSTQGIGGSSTPADLETAFQLLYQTFTQPGDDPNAFAMMRRQLEASVVNRQQNPMAVFGDRVALVNSSNHYTAQPLTLERLVTLDRAKMLAFYRARFSNAADFTCFVVGAFKVDELVPLLARYVGTLPSTGGRTSRFRDVGVHFPDHIVRERVDKGKEPRSEAAISFAADPPADSATQRAVNAATTVLEIALRDILREDLGQTYTVSADLHQALPQPAGGYVAVAFGAAPENIDRLEQRVLDEVGALQQKGPTADLTSRAKEAARRNEETALRQNGVWLGRLQTDHLLGRDPIEVIRRTELIDALTPQSLQQVFRQYFPLDRYTVVTLVPAEPVK